MSEIRSMSTSRVTTTTRTQQSTEVAEFRGGRGGYDHGRDRGGYDRGGWGHDRFDPCPPRVIYPQPVYPQPYYPQPVYPVYQQPVYPVYPQPVYPVYPSYPQPYYTGPGQAIGNLVGGLVDIFGR